MNPMIRQGFMDQMAQQSPSNPLQMGAANAQQSIQNANMNDQQRKMAQGLALQQFGAAMAIPRGQSTLGSISQSINPAIQAYLAQKNQAEQQNREMNDLQHKFEREQKKDALEREKFDELKNYHLALISQKNGEGGNQKFNLMKDNGGVPLDAISYNTMSVGEKRDFTKEQREAVKLGQTNKQLLDTVDEIQKVVDEYPDMYKDFNMLFHENAATGKVNITDFMKRNGIDPNKKTALDKMDKLSSRLVMSEIRSVGGRVATDAFKQLVSRSKPHFGITKEANDYILENLRKEYRPGYEYGKETRKAMIGGYYIPLRIEEMEQSDLNGESMENIPMEQSSEIPSEQEISPAAMAEAKRRLGMQ